MGHVRRTEAGAALALQTEGHEPIIPLPRVVDVSTPPRVDAPETPAQRVSRNANARMTSPERALDPRYQPRRSPQTYTVNGMTEARALDISHDRPYLLTGHGSAFTDAHNQGDAGNRFSHGVIIKTAGEIAEAFGIPQPVAAYIGAATMVPKEFGVDLHPSPSDMGIVDYRLVDVTNDRGQRLRVSGSVFFDGAFFGSAKVDF